MQRTVFFITMLTFFFLVAFPNKDSLSLLEFSSKLIQKGGEQFKAYRVELRTGEELINILYSGKDERFTLLLRKNMQYSMKLFANGSEMKDIFINTHLPWEEMNKAHHFDLTIEFPEMNCENYSEERTKAAGCVNFDPETRSFFYMERLLVEAGEEDPDITKPKY
jgi:hypothetical protein